MNGIRPLVSDVYGLKKTWYDYKLAVISTLYDYGMKARRENGVICVTHVTKEEETTYANITWKTFYEKELPKIIEAVTE